MRVTQGTSSGHGGASDYNLRHGAERLIGIQPAVVVSDDLAQSRCCKDECGIWFESGH